MSSDARARTAHAIDGESAADPVVKPPQVDGFAPAAPDGPALRQKLNSAEEKIDNLERALASQRQIGVAIGLLAHRFDCSPEKAWQVLVRLSQTTNVKVRDLSRVLADAHSGRIQPDDAATAASVAAQLPPEHRLP